MDIQLPKQYGLHSEAMCDIFNYVERLGYCIALGVGGLAIIKYANILPFFPESIYLFAGFATAVFGLFLSMWLVADTATQKWLRDQHNWVAFSAMSLLTALTMMFWIAMVFGGVRALVK